MMNLDGKKTYITAVAAALASFALAMGWLTKDQYQVILGLLGSLGLAALRSGVAKSAADQTREAASDEAAALPEGAKSTAGCSIGANG
jgi:hypothetical protein